MICDGCGEESRILIPVIVDTGRRTPLNEYPIRDSATWCPKCVVDGGL